jgi:DMSO reductase family type II enzyme chaperone
MFTFSLSGLEIKSNDNGPTEVEENETTSRSAVYMVFGKFFSPVNNEQYDAAINDHLDKEIKDAATLLPYSFDIGRPTVDSSLTLEKYMDEYSRLFSDSGGSKLLASSQTDDKENLVNQIKRDYEYFGLGANADARPLDHLATLCDFLQYLCFKEAATSSARLKSSFQRAQRDFLEHYLTGWIPSLVDEVDKLTPTEPFSWALNSLKYFILADYEYIVQILGG